MSSVSRIKHTFHLQQMSGDLGGGGGCKPLSGGGFNSLRLKIKSLLIFHCKAPGENSLCNIYYGLNQPSWIIAWLGLTLKIRLRSQRGLHTIFLHPTLKKKYLMGKMQIEKNIYLYMLPVFKVSLDEIKSDFD